MGRNGVLIGVLVVSLVCAAVSGDAQTTTGRLIGRTIDEHGSLLPGVGRESLLSSLEFMGVNVAQSVYTLSDLAESDGLFTTNAVYGPRPAILTAGESSVLEPVRSCSLTTVPFGEARSTVRSPW